MIRTLWVRADRSTWPTPPSQPRFPRTFSSRGQTCDINMLGTFLMIGLLTTPVDGSGVTLSEYWAWVRYLHAISEDNDLRITQSFADLDAHQKTILSDDFGMGVPMYWLAQRLNLRSVCDGKYFIDRIAALVGATAVRTAKRGPNKSPDFVAQGASGVWHVVECKGTQSGTAYRAAQLGGLGPPANGAVSQKRSITFPPSNTGQRLAAGLSIGVENGDGSSLLIVDPPPEKPYVVEGSHLTFAGDAVERAAVARALRLSGFEATASATASPAGRSPASRPTSGAAERQRRATVDAKAELARVELSERRERRLFRSGGDAYRGRTVRLDLPVPVRIDKQSYTAVLLRQGMRADVLTEMLGQPLVDGPFPEAAGPWRETIGQIGITGEGPHAELHLGKLFRSEIELLK